MNSDQWYESETIRRVAPQKGRAHPKVAWAYELVAKNAGMDQQADPLPRLEKTSLELRRNRVAQFREELLRHAEAGLNAEVLKRWREKAVYAGPVRELVADSWLRSIQSPNSVATAPHLQKRTKEQVLVEREKHPLAGAIAVVRANLSTQGQGDSVMWRVTDAEGMVLWTGGHQLLLNISEKRGTAEGSVWLEDVMGTNVIGTALAVGKSVQLHASEHFRAELDEWSAAAGVVKDPDTGAILGCIALAGGDDVALPRSLSLINATITAVEVSLKLASLNKLMQDTQNGVASGARAHQPVNSVREAVQARRERHAAAASANIQQRSVADAPAKETASDERYAAMRKAAADALRGGLPSVPQARETQQRLARERAHTEALQDKAPQEAETAAKIRRHAELAGLAAQAAVQGSAAFESAEIASWKMHVMGTRKQATLTAYSAQGDLIMGPLDTKLRHTEIIGVLSQNPEGMSAEQLLLAVYGDDANVVTLRAEMVRLRRAHPDLVAADRPYRLAVPLTLDIQEIMNLIDNGEYVAALRQYRGACLFASEAAWVNNLNIDFHSRLKYALKAVLAEKVPVAEVAELATHLLSFPAYEADFDLWSFTAKLWQQSGNKSEYIKIMSRLNALNARYA